MDGSPQVRDGDHREREADRLWPVRCGEGVVECADGWWPEAYNERNGWAIGEEREYTNQDEQDWNDSLDLYQLLENDIVPLYYERDGAGTPQKWLQWSKEAIATVAPVFSTRRMVKEYTTRLYMPASGVVKG